MAVGLQTEINVTGAISAGLSWSLRSTGTNVSRRWEARPVLDRSAKLMQRDHRSIDGEL